MTNFQSNMRLLDIPNEVLMMIVKQLDSDSLYCIYNTCTALRAIVCMHGTVKTCRMTVNRLAEVKLLKSQFFKHISASLLELNVSAMPQLTCPYLVPGLKKCKNLRRLDVSFTKIGILDVGDIHCACETLKDIAINFVFISTKHLRKKYEECQEIFKYFENVELVGSASNLVFSNSALDLLKKACLNKLQYTIAESNFVTPSINLGFDTNTMVKSNKFFLFFLNWQQPKFHCRYKEIRYKFFSQNYAEYESIVINAKSIDVYMVYAAPLFSKFIIESFDIEPECITKVREAMLSNAAVLMWNKNTVKFDDLFFKKLFHQLKHFLPFYINPNNKIPVPTKYGMYYITPKIETKQEPNQTEPELKRKRVAPPTVYLDYDAAFKEKQNIRLYLLFNEFLANSVTFNPKSDYLGKLTYLCLKAQSHTVFRFNSDIFDILLKHAPNLLTLNVEMHSPCSLQLSRALDQHNGLIKLKNIRIVETQINFKPLIASLAQCKTLENIILVSHNLCDVVNPSILVEKCPYLYNLVIESAMSAALQTHLNSLLKNAKKKYKNYSLNYAIYVKNCNHSPYLYVYEPYVSVFQLNLIRPLPL